MMKVSINIAICLIFMFSGFAVPETLANTVPEVSTSGESYTVAQSKSRRKRATSKRRRSTRRKRSNSKAELAEALKLSKQGKYEQASEKLFRLSVNRKYARERLQIKYILGLMLYQMKLYQLSAYQFISVIKAGKSKYLQQSLEKLSLAADAINDDTLLNYAIGKVKVNQFPKAHRDMLFFRIGEIQFRNKDYRQAIKSFKRVPFASIKFHKAKYMQGLAHAELNQTKSAINAFNELLDSRASVKVTDDIAVAARMALARTYYQQKKWAEAIEEYRRVPRDTPFWHDTMFESSWAMLRSGKFRSALSNFQTLHSAFYENFYLPESLLLRAIVYLYICKYDEMEKVLNLYTTIYQPLNEQISKFVKRTRKSEAFYEEVKTTMDNYAKSGYEADKSTTAVPLIIARRLSNEGDYQRSEEYIRNLLEEKRRIESLSDSWQKSGIGRYAKRVIERRIDKAKRRAGRQVRASMIQIQKELFDLSEQEGFIRYEMINGKKEALKKKVAGKELPTAQVDESANRNYYIQNGYQYYPFKGEAWLDELGNYHYVGTQSCE